MAKSLINKKNNILCVANKGKMKRILGFVITLIMILSSACCMNNNVNSFPINSDSSNSETNSDENSKEDSPSDSSIETEDFDLKYSEISAKIEENKTRLEELREAEERRSLINERILEFRRLLQKNEILSKFDRTILESVIENVIIGGVNEAGEKDPYQISFVYKMGIKDFGNVKKQGSSKGSSK